MDTTTSIPLTPVNSTMVEAHGYDAPSGTLRIQFKGGSIYDYPSVPAAVYADLQRADSVGQFVNRNIKPNYKGQKVQGSL
jgi:hypothetical protein